MLFRLAALVLLLLPCPALACSLCGTLSRKESVNSEYERARVVAYGRLSDPKLDPSTGSGTTVFHVEKVLKNGPGDKLEATVVLSRYLPVLDPTDPPRFVMFFNPVNGKLDATSGKQVHSPALLELLTGSAAYHGKPRDEALPYFARYLDHADAAVAEEAFLQFARATDQEVARAAKTLKPDVFRKLVNDPRTEAERLSLFAYLLGATGGPDDAAILRSMLRQPGERTTKALEGVLAGYVALHPKEGWEWAAATLADAKQSYLVRYGVVRAVRFLHALDPEGNRPHAVRGLALLIPDAELADVAVTELLKWRVWDHTKLILDQFGKSSHQAPIVRNGIVRYALHCPLPEARQFVEQLRRRDPELVRDLEEDLAFERGVVSPR